jgi:hypothetical protein
LHLCASQVAMRIFADTCHISPSSTSSFSYHATQPTANTEDPVVCDFCGPRIVWVFYLPRRALWCRSARLLVALHGIMLRRYFATTYSILLRLGVRGAAAETAAAVNCVSGGGGTRHSRDGLTRNRISISQANCDIVRSICSRMRFEIGRTNELCRWLCFYSGSFLISRIHQIHVLTWDTLQLAI